LLTSTPSTCGARGFGLYHMVTGLAALPGAIRILRSTVQAVQLRILGSFILTGRYQI